MLAAMLSGGDISKLAAILSGGDMSFHEFISRDKLDGGRIESGRILTGSYEGGVTN